MTSSTIKWRNSRLIKPRLLLCISNRNKKQLKMKLNKQLLKLEEKHKNITSYKIRFKGKRV